MWYKPANYVTSSDFMLLAKEDGLPKLASQARLTLSKMHFFGIHGTLLAENLCNQPCSCRLSDALTACTKEFCVKNDARTKDVVKAHEDASSALKSFQFTNGIDVTTKRMSDNRDEPSDELKTAGNALKVTVETAKRAMRLFCSSVHAILLLRGINLLRGEMLSARPHRTHFQADLLNATSTEQRCFEVLEFYLY